MKNINTLDVLKLAFRELGEFYTPKQSEGMRLLSLKIKEMEGSPKQTVFIATISHKHGTNVYVAHSKKELEEKVFIYVSEEWEQFVETEIPKNHKRAIKKYFDCADGSEFIETFEDEILPS